MDKNELEFAQMLAKMDKKRLSKVASAENARGAARQRCGSRKKLSVLPIFYGCRNPAERPVIVFFADDTLLSSARTSGDKNGQK